MLVGHPQAPICATTRKECRLQTPSSVYGKDRQTDDDRNQDVTMLQMVVPATLLSFFFFYFWIESCFTIMQRDKKRV